MQRFPRCVTGWGKPGATATVILAMAPAQPPRTSRVKYSVPKSGKRLSEPMACHRTGVRKGTVYASGQ